MRALISVWDKTGVVELAADLRDWGWEIVASGGTSLALAAAGVAHVDVADVTGFPEMLDGRVKTLHPRIHGGILADRHKESHREALTHHDISAIDLVVVNLYPFSSNPSIELIDVGGPTMVRAAAKNHHHVGVVTSPSQYDDVKAEIRANGRLSDETRHQLARAAFATTAAYDADIVAWLDQGGALGITTEDEELPSTLHLTLERAEILRYGENPHQRGARYRVTGHSSWWDEVTHHSGAALSYLNLFDADAAWRLVDELAGERPGAASAAIIKHANASGAALRDTVAEAYSAALEADPMSAFGGVVALGGFVDEELAALVASGPQADVIIADGYSDGALETLRARRKSTRLLSGPRPEPLARTFRTSGALALVQTPDLLLSRPGQWRVVTRAQPSAEQWIDLAVAWRVCARTTSNAIVLAKNGAAVGVGAGQQSRVVAARIAGEKAGLHARGSSAASDAFFPFADGLEALTAVGVQAIVQPGGSVRDADVIAAADEAGVVMVMTGERHFRH